MATIQTMSDALMGLTNGFNLPGLDLDSVAQLMVKSNPTYSTSISNCKTQDEKDAMTTKFVNYYKNEGSVIINNHINTIKSSIVNIQSGITNTKTAIVGATTAAGIPTTLPAVVPQVSSLKTSVDNLQRLLIPLLTSAIAISFILPDEIMILIDAVAGLYILINAIPI